MEQRTNKTEKLSNLVSTQGEPENFDAYSEVELSKEEVAAALLIARRTKYAEQKTAEYKQLLKQETQYPNYSSTELYQMVHDAGFEVDETNKQVIWDLCKYFSGNPTGPYNLRKGIMLYGPVGCYKTSLMRFFANNQTNSFVLYPVNDVSSQFSKDGHDAIVRYKGLIPSTDTFRTFGQKELGVCFDDLGTEVDKKHYGNEANVMAEIILSRFMSHYNLMGKTHFTTNINTATIEERYGVRVKSRLREMVNLVEFPDNSPDRRK